MRSLIPVAALTLTACSGGERPAAPVVPAAPDWRTLATPYDRQRLRDWRKAWVAALPQARAADPAGVRAQGALLEPDLSLPGAIPPSGAYACRVVKLGAKGARMRGYTAYPPFECRVGSADGVVTLAKLTGSQRPTGRILPDPGGRAVFLGTLVLGDERGAMRYGADQGRDMAGWVERIGPERWRLVLPYPRFESLLDVVELVPAEGGRVP